MRIMSKATLRRFWETSGLEAAQTPLQAWHDEASKANWLTPQAIKNAYATASICGNNRVVFNIGGNKYRLVVEVAYAIGAVFVKFVGTHAQYDKIDVETINDY